MKSLAKDVNDSVSLRVSCTFQVHLYLFYYVAHNKLINLGQDKSELPMTRHFITYKLRNSASAVLAGKFKPFSNEMFIKHCYASQMHVAHTCNPSYWKGKD
jgi:hypothetical protein